MKRITVSLSSEIEDRINKVMIMYGFKTRAAAVNFCILKGLEKLQMKDGVLIF